MFQILLFQCKKSVKNVFDSFLMPFHSNRFMHSTFLKSEFCQETLKGNIHILLRFDISIFASCSKDFLANLSNYETCTINLSVKINRVKKISVSWKSCKINRFLFYRRTRQELNDQSRDSLFLFATERFMSYFGPTDN